MVNFTDGSYDVEVNETIAIVRVKAFGEFRSPFLVNVSIYAAELSERSTYIHIVNNCCSMYRIVLCILFYNCFISAQLKPFSLQTLWKCYFQLTLILP